MAHPELSVPQNFFTSKQNLRKRSLSYHKAQRVYCSDLCCICSKISLYKTRTLPLQCGLCKAGIDKRDSSLYEIFFFSKYYFETAIFKLFSGYGIKLQGGIYAILNDKDELCK